MKGLSEFSIEELEAEIKKRNEPPDPIASKHINLTKLQKQAAEYLQQIKEKGYTDDDSEHFIFEAVMETFYGTDIWKWINKYTR